MIVSNLTYNKSNIFIFVIIESKVEMILGRDKLEVRINKTKKLVMQSSSQFA